MKRGLSSRGQVTSNWVNMPGSAFQVKQSTLSAVRARMVVGVEHLIEKGGSPALREQTGALWLSR